MKLKSWTAEVAATIWPQIGKRGSIRYTRFIKALQHEQYIYIDIEILNNFKYKKAILNYLKAL
jgi:hypothetical protein